jgi:import inner membrane translocase subunit TIM8
MAGDKSDAEFQEFLQIEQQKAQLTGQIHRLTDVCWDTCVMERPKDRLDGRTETCVSNCVDRFIDVSLTITGRFQQMLQRSMQQ